MGVKLNRFTILLWKNTLHLFRNYLTLIFVIIVPVTCLAFLLIVRFHTENVEKVETKQFPEFVVSPYSDPISKNLRNAKVILYSPTTCPLCVEIMDKMEKSLKKDLKMENQLKFISFPTFKDLKKYAESINVFDFLCAISFAENLQNDSVRVAYLKPKVTFPSGLRTVPWTNPVSNQLYQWTTERLVRNALYGDETTEKNPKVGLPDYFKELALTVLYLLQKTITKYAMYQKHIFTFNIDSLKLPDLTMQRFTERESKINQFLYVFRPFIPIFVIFYFISSKMLLLRMLSWEKQKQLKEYMHVAGLNATIYWFSWYVFSVLLSLPFLLLIFIIFSTGINKNVPALFVYSNYFLIFVIFFLYMCVSISFIFLISNIFTNTHVALRVGGVLFILAGLPYYIIQDEVTLPFSVVFFLCFIFQTPMCIALDIICRLELSNEGVTFSNVSGFAIFHKYIDLRFTMIMLFFNAILYFILALYIHAVFPKYGVGKKWNFFLFFWRKSKFNTVAESSEFLDFEKNKKKNRCVIRMNNLMMVKRKLTKVLNSITINIYEDELTVIFGKNGSGKSMLSGILVGSILPTSGDIAVTGLNLLTEREQIRTNIGYCPQTPILFDYLTTEEHLLFFGYLRGLPTKKATSEMNFYLKALKLENFRKVRGKDLPFNVQKILCLALALCGGPKVVILDEPTAGFGMDKLNYIWNLLRREKEGRSIIVMTYSLEETFIIGDRIAVMKKGRIKCYGSKKFISSSYNLDGYFMKLEKGDFFENDLLDVITNEVLKIIPEAVVDEDIEISIIYKFPDKSRDKLSELCDMVVNNKNSWNITDYAIYTPGTDEYKERIFREERQNVLETYKPPLDLTKFTKRNFGNFFVVFRKHVLAAYLQWGILIMKWFTPVALVVILSILLNRNVMNTRLILDEFSFSPTPIVLVEENHWAGTELVLGFIFIQQNRGVEVIVVKQNQMENYYNDMQKVSLGKARTHVLYGIQFLRNGKAKCWFNGKTYLHASALCASNVFGLSTTKPEFATFPSKIFPRRLLGGYYLIIQCVFLTFSCELCLLILESYFALYYIKEEVTQFKSFQIMCGIKRKTYWLSAFLWDLIVYLLIMLFITCLLYVFDTSSLQHLKDMMYVVCVFTLFSLCFLPKTYLWTYIYKISYGLGFAIVVFYTEITLAIFYFVYSNLMEVNYVTLISPYYVFGLTLFRSYKNARMDDLCKGLLHRCTNHSNLLINTPFGNKQEIIQKCKNYICKETNHCCKEPESVPEILLLPVISFICWGILCFILLACIESFRHKFNLKRKHDKKFNKIRSVYRERKTIFNLNQEDFARKGVVVKNLNKVSRIHPNLYNMFLICEKYQCTCLLGPDGSGKNLLFKILMGEIERTSGQIWINKKLVKNHNDSFKMCGYSPKMDTLPGFLTVKHLLMYISEIKGYSYEDSKIIVEELGDYYQLKMFFNYKIINVSSDIKKKIHNALAFVGMNPVLLFDQPTTGTDVASKILFWRQLEAAKAHSCILLATNDLEECLTVCSKTAIFYKGEIIWINKAEDIRKLFTGGVVLQISFIYELDFFRLKKFKESVMSWMDVTFEQVMLLQDIYDRVIYFIPNFDILPSKMFAMMEEVSGKYNIRKYTLHDINLSQMFSLFVEDFKIQHP